MAQGNAYSQTLKKIKRAMSLDPLFFAKKVAPDIFKHDFGTFHRCMVDDILETKNTITEIMVTRRHGKSMVATVLMPLWLVLHKGWQYIIIVSQSETVAKKFIKHIQNIVESERFKNYYGTLKGSETGDEWNKTTVTLRGQGLHARIECKGAGMQFAGLNESLAGPSGEMRGVRPQLVVIDDIEDDDTVKNALLIDDLEGWLNGTVKPALHDSKSKIFLIGTTYKADCLLTRVENYKRGVKVIKYPLVVNSERLSQKLGLPMESPIWPENPDFSPEEVDNLKNYYIDNNNWSQFLLQYMLDSSAGSVIRFDRDDIETSKFQLGDLFDKKLNWYMTVDMAFSREKHADKSAVVLCAWDKDRDCYVVDAKQGRWGDAGTVDQMVMMYQEYDGMINESIPVCVETHSLDAAERLIEEKFYDAGISFYMRELKPRNRPKENRIRKLVPISQAHKLHLRSDIHMKELERQMLKFHGLAQGKDDDLIDALAYQLDEATPPRVIDEEEERKKKNHELHLRLWSSIDPDLEPEKRGINYRRQFVRRDGGMRIQHGARG